jgi:hypothetical protein
MTLLQRISPGHGNIAEMKDIVKANIIIFLEENPNDPIESLQNAHFKIGEGDAVPGFLLSLAILTVASRARTRSSPQSPRREVASEVHLEVWVRSQWSPRIGNLRSDPWTSQSHL